MDGRTATKIEREKERKAYRARKHKTDYNEPEKYLPLRLYGRDIHTLLKQLYK